MPGFLYHLACGEIVQTAHRELEYEPFMLGNLLPDLAADKNLSHYYQEETPYGWKVPDLELAKKELYVPDPLLFGAYCHLALDAYFFERCLVSRFQILDGEVFDRVMGRKWPTGVFFSETGLYGCYSRGNFRLIESGMVPVRVFELPEYPPLSGVARLDERSSRNWLSEVERYLSHPRNQFIAAEVFTEAEVIEAIEEGAREILNELHKNPLG